MNCVGCVYARWERTANDRLHPNKQGQCTALEGFSIPSIPAAFYWGSSDREPKPSGGYIERDKELNRSCSWRKEDAA
jgi:hypothetical protein